METRKAYLIEELKKEKELLNNRGFDNTVEHDIVIHYLETGETDEDVEEYPMLDSAINDFDTLCYDYEV